VELEITDHPENARFEVRGDGEMVGFVEYRLRDGELALLHTETDIRFRHRGIAGRLIQSTLDSARERHLVVLPYCSFVRRWIADHPEYADLVPEGRRQEFGLLPTPVAPRPPTGPCRRVRHPATSRPPGPGRNIAAPMSLPGRLRFTVGNLKEEGRQR
jgi:uncharacterized protein